MPLFKGSKDKYVCKVMMLDNTEQTHHITSKDLGIDLIDKVFIALDLYEKEYFGLKFQDRDHQNHWLEETVPVKKQLNHAPFTFFFGVKFYAADPTKLREEITRYQFFLQIKKDMFQGKLPCDNNIAAELCAYAVQSELGDYDENIHTDGLISEFRFVPNQSTELEGKIAEMYPKLRGLLPSDAEAKFLERVKWLEMYGVELHPVKGQDNMEYLLGLTPTGIVLFKTKQKIGSFIWPKITKMKNKSNCFLLRATQGRNDEEKEYTFVCVNKEAAKALWKCCAAHHTFFRLEKARDVPASAYNFLFRKGSGFRFVGRTQQEVERDADQLQRSQPPIHRTGSKRYSRRNNEDMSQGTGSLANNINGLHHQSTPTGAPKGTSPKFPRKLTGGYHSAGEQETRTRKQRYYSGYVSGNSDSELKARSSRHKYGSEPNVHHKGVPLEADDSFRDENRRKHKHRHTSRESLPAMGVYVPPPNDYDPRYSRPSGSKSDSEEQTRQRRHQQRVQRNVSWNSESEMVPALDIYHQPGGVAMSADQERRRRPQHRHQHRNYRHSHHGFDPANAQVLLELGPESAHHPPPDHPRIPNTSFNMMDKENIHHNSTPPHQTPMSNGAYHYHTPYYTPHKLPGHYLEYGPRPIGRSPGQYFSQQQFPKHADALAHGPPSHRPHYVEQVIAPSRTVTTSNIRPVSSYSEKHNYNISTEL